jgi:aspartyl protease family protein
MFLRKFVFLASLALHGGTAFASDVGVVGLFPGKAVLVIDGGAPKTYSVGNSVTGNIKLIAVSQSMATLDINGKRQTIAIGEHINRAAPAGPASVTLKADGRGHFMAQGQVNGGVVRMLVDTGATMIALSAADAVRLGIDYKKGQPGMVNTANGAAPVYRVTLNTVKVGDIELNQVDALVQEAGLPFALLGMSFLNRTEMRREGDQMTLTKRY